jgi:hypothetical protein
MSSVDPPEIGFLPDCFSGLQLDDATSTVDIGGVPRNVRGASDVREYLQEAKALLEELAEGA